MEVIADYSPLLPDPTRHTGPEVPAQKVKALMAARGLRAGARTHRRLTRRAAPSQPRGMHERLSPLTSHEQPRDRAMDEWAPSVELRDRIAHARTTGRADLRTADWIGVVLAQHRRAEPVDARRQVRLDVEREAGLHVLSGVIESPGRTIAVTLELTDSSSREIIWADRLAAPVDEIGDLRARHRRRPSATPARSRPTARARSTAASRCGR